MTAITVTINGVQRELSTDTTMSNLAKILDIRMLEQITWNGHSLDNNKDTLLHKITEKKPLFQIYNKLFFDNEYDMSKNRNQLCFKKSGFAVEFMRTIRVPDNGKEWPLPPELGTFKIYNNNTIAMYQKEAMWMKFFSNQGHVAVKIGVGDVNVISGEKWEDGVLKQSPVQNYVICPQQLWLDGIRVSSTNKRYEREDLVRQFVAMPLDDISTIEQQMKEMNIIDRIVGGLRFEVHRLCNKNFQVMDMETKMLLNVEDSLDIGKDILFFVRRDIPLDKTILDYGFRDGDVLYTSKVARSIFVQTIWGATFSIFCDLDITIDKFRVLVSKEASLEEDQIRLIFSGTQLEDGRQLIDYGITYGVTLYVVLRLRGGGDIYAKMGMSAGGLIKQKIYLDDHRITDYFAEWETKRVQIANSIQFGNKMEPSTITARTYMTYGYPWFDLYDERIPSIAKQDGTKLDNIKSISKFDNVLEECCVCMDKYANVKLDPCCHYLCEGCVQRMMSESCDLECPLCRCTVVDIITLAADEDLDETDIDPDAAHVVAIDPKIE